MLILKMKEKDGHLAQLLVEHSDEKKSLEGKILYLEERLQVVKKDLSSIIGIFYILPLFPSTLYPLHCSHYQDTKFLHPYHQYPPVGLSP